MMTYMTTIPEWSKRVYWKRLAGKRKRMVTDAIKAGIYPDSYKGLILQVLRLGIKRTEAYEAAQEDLRFAQSQAPASAASSQVGRDPRFSPAAIQYRRGMRQPRIGESTPIAVTQAEHSNSLAREARRVRRAEQRRARGERMVVGPAAAVEAGVYAPVAAQAATTSSAVPFKVVDGTTYTPTTSAQVASPASSTVAAASQPSSLAERYQKQFIPPEQAPDFDNLVQLYDWQKAAQWAPSMEAAAAKAAQDAMKDAMRTASQSAQAAQMAAMQATQAMQAQQFTSASSQVRRSAPRTPRSFRGWGSYEGWGDWGATPISGITPGPGGYYYQYFGDHTIHVVAGPKYAGAVFNADSHMGREILAKVSPSGWNPVGRNATIKSSSSAVVRSPTSAVVTKKYKGINAILAAIGGGDPKKGGQLTALLAAQYGPGAVERIAEGVQSHRESPARIMRKIARLKVKYGKHKAKGNRVKAAKYAAKIRGLEAHLAMLQGGAQVQVPVGPVEAPSAGMPSWVPLAAVGGGLALVVVMAAKK